MFSEKENKFLVGEPELNIWLWCVVCGGVWCPLDGCDALIGQRGTSVQLYTTVHLGQCTLLVYTNNSNSPHNTLSKLAWVSTVQ